MEEGDTRHLEVVARPQQNHPMLHRHFKETTLHAARPTESPTGRHPFK